MSSSIPMTRTVNLSKTATVKHIALTENGVAAVYTGNLYIHIVNTHTNKSDPTLKKFDVSSHIAGLHFDATDARTLYAIDDSFGLHIFNVVTSKKHKVRMNPEMENHYVTCTAVSKSFLVVASSVFAAGIADVRVSKRNNQQNYSHALSIFDLKNAIEPLTTYYQKHTASITSLDFYKNGTFLLTGDESGAVKSFNLERRDEGNALRWERWINGPVTKVGMINKRIAYAIGNNSEVNVFIDSKDKLDVLYGSVRDTASGKNEKPSPALYASPSFVVGLVKGVADEIPLIAVWGTEGSNKITLTAMDQQGVKQPTDVACYTAHKGSIKVMATNKTQLITGGEDGSIVVRKIDFVNDVEETTKSNVETSGSKKESHDEKKQSDEKRPKEEKKSKDEKKHKDEKKEKERKEKEKSGSGDKKDKKRKNDPDDDREKNHKKSKEHKKEKTEKSV